MALNPIVQNESTQIFSSSPFQKLSLAKPYKSHLCWPFQVAVLLTFSFRRPSASEIWANLARMEATQRHGLQIKGPHAAPNDAETPREAGQKGLRRDPTVSVGLQRRPI